MLQNCLRLVLLDRLGHHVKNIVHDSSAQFEVVVRLDTLLRNRLGDALAVSPFELTSEQVSKPIKMSSAWKVNSRNLLTISQAREQYHA